MGSSEKSSLEAQLADGIYDQILTRELEVSASQAFVHATEKIDGTELTKSILNYIGPKIQRHLDEISDEKDRVEEANAIIAKLGLSASPISKPLRFLGLINSEFSGTSKISKRPMIPLSEFALLTNLPNEPRIGHEIRAELESADSVDIVMSFVMIHGVNFLENELRDFANRGGKIRLITTTYMGNSDAKAIIRLAEEYGAEIRISLDRSKDRLHAKSWIFHRASGFSTAYVGSSNLSFSALNQGNEWNVKISKYTSPELFAKVNASFLELWNKENLLNFDSVQHKDFLESELNPRNLSTSIAGRTYTYLDVTPRPHQIGILNDLERERNVFDRHWNLVVSATGTGKTITSALDYRRLAESETVRPNLLFVAHKEEILNQALDTFRAVLRDQSFGELFVGGKLPSEWRHVFASIQSLNNMDFSSVSPSHFEFVIVDEFHHAEAPTYRALLNFLKPKELLALTATPERTDLVNVQESFFGGHIASEIRLWDAIDEGLLTPFQYYGISDGTDLSSVKWVNGKYSRTDLENVFTGNDARNTIIFNAFVKYIPDISNSRSLSFCTSISHADEMAEFFSRNGVPAVSVTSNSTSFERGEALRKLKSREIQMICAVDIFNEGIDIPEIDTVLFLRPTESPLIFLQQLGRGLRLAPGKQSLTVLDFVGVQRAEYKFGRKLEALLGQRHLSIKESLENDFPYLPSGCQITFDKQSKELVLSNLKSQLSSRSQYLISLLSQGEQPLIDFLAENDLEISDIYKNGRTWSSLKQQAKFGHCTFNAFELTLSRRLASFFYASDPIRNKYYRNLVNGSQINFEDRSQFEKILTSMLFWNLFPDGKDERGAYFNTYDDGIRFLQKNQDLKTELLEVLEVAHDACDFTPMPLVDSLSALPLSTHAYYSRPELLAAFGYANLAQQAIWPDFVSKNRGTSAHVTGVCHIPHLASDLFLVTLDKSGNSFSQKTAYKDFAISPWLFHWESQNKDSAATPAGKRYLNHRENGHELVLAVRAKRINELGTAPFQLLGQSLVESHEGEFPISITLRLARQMPQNIIQSSPVHSIA